MSSRRFVAIRGRVDDYQCWEYLRVLATTQVSYLCRVPFNLGEGVVGIIDKDMRHSVLR